MNFKRTYEAGYPLMIASLGFAAVLILSFLGLLMLPRNLSRPLDPFFSFILKNIVLTVGSGIAGLIAGFVLDKKYLEEEFGESPKAIPLKGIGLALYIRQRNRIIRD